VRQLPDELVRLLLRGWKVLPIPRALRALVLWSSTTHYIVAVSAIIWDAEGRVLLARHTYRPGLGWNLPGGALQGLESLDAGLRRELAEELGCTVAVEGLVGGVVAPAPRRAEFAFNRRWQDGEFRPNLEIAAIAYFTPAEALRLLPRESRILVQQAARLRAKRAPCAETDRTGQGSL
jgi:8-oxo-dGTP diphosphatase